MLTPSQKGAIAETAFVHHATRLGLGAFRPCSEGERYDLILDRRPALIRVQCKWGTKNGDVVSAPLGTSRRGPSGFIRGSYTPGEIDAFGIYCQAIDRCFLVPIDAIHSRRHLHL